MLDMTNRLGAYGAEVAFTHHPCQGTSGASLTAGVGYADSAPAASCRTRVIQYAVPHVLPLLHPFPILIIKHHKQQGVKAQDSK